MSTTAYDPDSGTLRASAAAFAALRDGSHSEELDATGARTAGEPHAALGPALQAMRAPVCELTLLRGTRRARGWVDGEAVALLVPEDDAAERLALRTLPTTFVPDALARLNDLGPRPRVEPAVRLRLPVSELATRLANPKAPALPPAGMDETEAAALRTLAASLTEHWRVEARWRPSPDSPGVRIVEVVDTTAGLWLVVPDGPSVELWPTTPTTVFRQLSALLPNADELAGP